MSADHFTVSFVSRASTICEVSASTWSSDVVCTLSFLLLSSSSSCTLKPTLSVLEATEGRKDAEDAALALR